MGDRRSETDVPTDAAQDRIKVTDRRHFTASGERRAELAEEPDEVPVAPPVAASGPGFEHKPVVEPEGVDFTMLVNAMAQPALLFLGEIPHPGTDETVLELEQAKLQIDMLEVLAVKCRGNLSPPEERLLDRVLYQLRMLYVARSSGTA